MTLARQEMKPLTPRQVREAEKYATECLSIFAATQSPFVVLQLVATIRKLSKKYA